jgi:hypothetical protein
MFLPRTHGTARVNASPATFISAFARRVETGLLPGTAPARSRYRVTDRQDYVVRFEAENLSTALNVGLNSVEINAAPSGTVLYTIGFEKWAGFSVGLGLLIGAALVTVFMTIDLRTYLAQNPSSLLPGLSLDQNVALAWTLTLFWSFAWPWVLIVLHKRPLRGLMNRIIAEVDAAAASA